MKNINFALSILFFLMTIIPLIGLWDMISSQGKGLTSSAIFQITLGGEQIMILGLLLIGCLSLGAFYCQIGRSLR